MKLVSISLLVLSSMSIFCCSSMQLNHPRILGNETDRLALLAIKAQIQHDPNQVTSSWNDSLHFCLWLGVTCSQRHRQRVVKLELGSLALVGSISPHIGNLSFLRELDLRNNSFTHHIPPQIGQLHRLQVLYLNNNSFNGFIPPSISNFSKLTFLNLGSNNLVGKIPYELGSLSKLQFISLDFNNLTGEIPHALGNISSLDLFSVVVNNLEGKIPTSLCQWKKLTFIAVATNRLSGLSCIYNLSSIVTFEISDNQFQGSFPPNLGNTFPNLQIFSVYLNQFTGVIPLSISNATNLLRFQCDSNKLTGHVPNLKYLHKIKILSFANNNLGSGKHGDLSFVSELINATRLSVLDFGNNSFGGPLPISISNLSTNLSWLSLQINQLHGSIPARLGNLVNLEGLFMSDNFFTGSIPSDIGKLSKLGWLYIDNNQIAGSIPSSLGNLTLLTLLVLQENNLEGSLPSNLGKCQSLLELRLSRNNLNGTIPPQIFDLSSLSKTLALDENQFIGTLPVEIGKLNGLGELDISNNMLSGELPSSLGSCQSLEILHLQGNFFNGRIPSSMQDLRGIRVLDLSRNNLSGDIPQYLQNMKLEKLNLSFNQFSGAVPIGGVLKNASATSVAGNSRLCGGIVDLRLPLCKSKESKGGGLSRRMKLMISLVSGFTLFGLAIVLSFIILRKKRKECDLSSLGNSERNTSVWRVSYATLRKATGGFSSTNLIGVGGFGSVYKVLLHDGKVVAVKVLNMLHRGAFKSFMAECEALRNIRHRNLVKILTACSGVDSSGNDFKAIVYEFMDNGSLEEWLHPSTGNEASKGLSLIQRLNIAIDVASALDYLHNHCETPIVHCDLKPSNVLLDGDLTGHVSDFGLSKFLSVSTMSVSANQSSSIGIRGSVGYAAPEYGMGSLVSTFGDVYSFGILLLEMFTGKKPTDHMFNDGLNLHNYVKTALPECASEISESLLLQESTTDAVEAHQHSRLSVTSEKAEECVALILGIGVACSVESPANRKDMSDVASELQSIRRNLLG